MARKLKSSRATSSFERVDKIRRFLVKVLSSREMHTIRYSQGKYDARVEDRTRISRFEKWERPFGVRIYLATSSDNNELTVKLDENGVLYFRPRLRAGILLSGSLSINQRDTNSLCVLFDYDYRRFSSENQKLIWQRNISLPGLEGKLAGGFIVIDL